MSGELNKSSGSESSFYNMSLQSFEPVQSLTSPTSPDQPAQSPTPIPRPRKAKENERLKTELASKERQIEDLQRQISQRMESDRVREREMKEKQKLEGKITDLEERLSLMSLMQAPKEKGPKRSDVIIIKKLEKAMKDNHDLKQVRKQCCCDRCGVV